MIKFERVQYMFQPHWKKSACSQTRQIDKKIILYWRESKIIKSQNLNQCNLSCGLEASKTKLFVLGKGQMMRLNYL